MSIDFLYEIYKKRNEISTDSRRIADGCLFFALKGETFDGNRFAAQALKDGAAVAVVDDASIVPVGDELSDAQPQGHYILVPDVLATLQALAAHHRQQFSSPVIQVTGTNGKTTTKELLAAVLSRKYNVLYTQGNLNNHIGVPLTLLRLRPEEHEIAIIETGANHPGEIALLANIVNPDYGLITNVGRAHLEGFGSFEGVKRTKGELYDYLLSKSGARIFACVSSPDLQSMLAVRCIDIDGEKCITYAHEGEAAASTLCTGKVASCNPTLNVSWQQHAGSTHHAVTQLIGDYNLDNVLAAICVGLHFGVATDEINEALREYKPSLGRSELRQTATNRLIVDAYNANLTSMLAALDNFSRIEHEHKMVILGAMRELGETSNECHCQVLQRAFTCGAHCLWFVGKEFTEVLACVEKPSDLDIRTFEDVDAVKQAIASGKPNGQLILIKGSNSTRLHQLPEIL